MPAGSRRTTNLSQALHRLQTPSNRISGACVPAIIASSISRKLFSAQTSANLSAPDSRKRSLRLLFGDVLHAALVSRLGRSLPRPPAHSRAHVSCHMRVARSDETEEYSETTADNERAPGARKNLRLATAPPPDFVTVGRWCHEKRTPRERS